MPSQDVSAPGNLWLTFDASTGVGLEANGQPIEIPGGISRVVITPSGTVQAALTAAGYAPANWWADSIRATTRSMAARMSSGWQTSIDEWP